MKQEIKNAIDIADAYRNENDGEIPVLVIAHTESGVQNVFVGVFRTHKNHIVEDQKMFCSVMRMAFAINNVTSYELLVKPEFNYAVQNMTLNVLAVVAVSETGKTVEWFEIEDEGLTPHFSEMPVEGMFTQLLPTEAERKVEYPAKAIKGINQYLDNCTYTVPTKAEVVADAEVKEASAFDAMVAAFG